MRKTDTVEKVRKPRAKKAVAEKPAERPEDLPEVVEETCPVIPEPAVTIDPPSDAPVEPEALSFEVFIARKSQLDGDFGFAPLWMPEYLFDFQAALVDWALRKGRAAIFADCGLGKTVCELVWCENVFRKTGKPVLILTPLAVAQQFVTEGSKFDVTVHRIRDGKVEHGVNVTNYEQLHKLKPSDFGGVACDESSILKNCDGATRSLVTEFLRTLEYRLLCTATAAPNDLPELGTSSEALGYLGHMDMLSKFFKNDRNNSVDTGGKWRGHAAPRAYVGPQWRFRGHAEEPFWRWVCSWARSLRKPSDLGFDDRSFALPPLIEREHVVPAKKPREGMLFAMPAVGLREEREERRRTIQERCEMAAALVRDSGEHAVMWCHLNDEGDLLEKLVPGAIQISGKDSEEWKELVTEWFQGHACICNRPEFRAKLPGWGIAKSIIEPTTSNTGRSGSPSRRSMPKSTGKKNESIFVSTIKTTSTDTSGHRSNGTPAMRVDANDMPLTQNIGNDTSETPNSAIQKSSGTQDFESNTESPFPSTTNCFPHREAGVPSVEQRVAQTWIDEVGKTEDSTSTTVTPPGKSEDCSAPLVTWESGNSPTTPTALSEPPCICGHMGRRVLVSKPTLFGWGLNFQHCAHMTTFSTNSFEQDYQAVRRCWRFGQSKPVVVDRVLSDGESRVIANLRRKAEQAEVMFENIVRYMRDALHITRGRTFDKKEELPSWL